MKIPMPARPRHDVRRWTMLAGGAAGVSAAAIYLFHPERGSAHRAKIRDLRNRAVGLGAGLRYRVAGRKVDDTVLVERVRSRLGLASGHAKAIEVSSTDGRLRLAGDVLADEHDAVVRTVSRTPGVRDVDDALVVHETIDGVTRLHGRTRERAPVTASA
jgi:hypothetical protein